MDNVNEKLTVALLLRWHDMTERNEHSEVLAEIAGFFAEHMDSEAVEVCADTLEAIRDEHEAAGSLSTELADRRWTCFTNLMEIVGGEHPTAIAVVRQYAL